MPIRQVSRIIYKIWNGKLSKKALTFSIKSLCYIRLKVLHRNIQPVHSLLIFKYRFIFMASHPTEKKYTLTPSWKQYFWAYLLSVLTIPLLGTGLIAFYLTWKKHHETSYVVTDSQITLIGKKYRRNVDLVDIDRVEVARSGMKKKLGIGTIILYTSALRLELKGIEQPEEVGNILEKAIRTGRQQTRQQEQQGSSSPSYDPGAMDKIEYLTGLWQQGLLSEEDYQRERKHIEE